MKTEYFSKIDLIFVCNNQEYNYLCKVIESDVNGGPPVRAYLLVMSAYSLTHVLVSLASEFSNEPKSVVINAMTAFLCDSFDWISESEAMTISVKAYEMRRLMDISADYQSNKDTSSFNEKDVLAANAAFSFVKENSLNFTCAPHRIFQLWEMALIPYC